MKYELRKLSVDDGRDVYDMMQEMPKEENGFMNSCYGLSFEEYKKWLVHSDDTSKGVGLEDWMVPQGTYWLYVDEIPMGFAKLRHHLTEKLRQEGGHAGYAIRPSQRGKGYGKLLLTLLLPEAKKLGIEKMLVTVWNGNTPSIRVALANGGTIEKADDIRHYIWVDC